MLKKGWGERDFALTHPKGALGKKLVRVETLMHKGEAVPRVPVSAPMAEAIEEMSRKKLGMTCVVHPDGRLAGLITDGDLRRLIGRHKGALLKRTAGQGLTADPVTIGRGVLATEALNLMERRKITSLVVLAADGRVEGVIHLHDLWRTEMF
jgi:arabinose-5-phosphate isomerase